MGTCAFQRRSMQKASRQGEFRSSQGPRHTRQFVAMLLCVLSVAGRGPHAEPQVPAEYQTKAAFLYNFVKFVEWPAGTLPNDRAPIVVGVLGEDPFGSVLDDEILGKAINRHQILILRTNSVRDLKSCQIAFISPSETKHLPQILVGLRGASILTVGEAEHFAQLGGMIQFTLEGNKVHFAINVDAAERARLKVSSKLLSLATVVHDEVGRRGS
jgi:hypothetical protein